MTPEIEARLLSAKRLFVDVDDTLIRHITQETRTGLFIIEGYEVSRRIQERMKDFVYYAGKNNRSRGHGEVLVVWSSGGKEWARRAWEMTELNHPFWESDVVTTEFRDKDNLVPQEGDLFIDDDPLPSFAAATIHPREFE